jgi:alkanesulfonate monooxygenase SsuD/methylene tetrahydromethanopterin reductase-like flavin-dependent oxidoreductase (luciferase family)
MEKASRGEPMRYEGEYQDIDIKGWIRPHKTVRDRVPIYTAAMREGMCRMAGDVADGLIAPDQMVDAYTAAGPLDKVRSRVEQVAERGDGVWLTPPTYFIPPEQIGEYQAKLIEAFGPS